MKSLLYRSFIELTNGRVTSGIIKSFAESKMSRRVVPSFAKWYGINQEEMGDSISSYPTLKDFFIRELKQGARKIDAGENTIVSPVDAVIEDVGDISQNSEFKVKGKNYSLKEMFGNRGVEEKYIGGVFMVLYLSPSHYHRIHSPVDGRVAEQYTLGKKSFPVNKMGMKHGKSTLAKNYRCITELDTKYGHVAVAKVGAMFINSIELTHQGDFWRKGQGVAYFSFGSTVVLFFEKDVFEKRTPLQVPYDIQMGEVIGYYKKAKNSI
ncbi:phosphatidylserine decarboxylase [Falsibacillus pallidus]|uniref:Phosphatidylserine decarboxylase proenzyme n=1 Tax=Falsibacillus pallidus TaxID=493781 RepID=A0A370GNN3_9BACI|nr:phosphatidylserine decarboxylase [Falsibacillus pallidus]RDI44044.1 phosphatidylserine decarboxylase [Falsibacillus pallidus]